MTDNVSSISVEDKIYGCIDLDNPKSFFLVAGAGSGKTRSLVEALKRFRAEKIMRLRRSGQQIAVITYTNAACDEIKSRLEFDPAFHISTIHSFAWGLIKPYTNDIKAWLKNSLETEIKELNDLQSKARNTNTKTYIDRASKIESKAKRIKSLETIRKFSYNPNGENTGKDSLNHSEVISVAASFIMTRDLMQSILVRKYPILLIDESQDTKKELIDAFFELQKKQASCFTLGMFGDTMQRIYMDGKLDLGQNIPDTWAKPVKPINHRSPKRVITLINKIRAGDDGQTQTGSKDEIGVVRLFIVDTASAADRAIIESRVSSQMALMCNDDKWNDSQCEVKVLTLEHHMAAERGGFSDFFEPLYSVDKLKTGLLDGTLTGVSFFANQILPLTKAMQSDDHFAAARIVQKNSALIRKEVLHGSPSPVEELKKANDAAKALFALWHSGIPSLNDVLKEVFRSGIFQVPDVLIPIAERLCEKSGISFEESVDAGEKDIIIDAWDQALKCSFSKFEEYVRYIADKSRFGTHQGIKGLEFPRVMVILDDEEARGFLFSYEKLFGAKGPSETDIKNEKEGKETSIERTRRLFYVTCSRAQESLAIVAYTKDPLAVRNYALSQNWFDENEIISL
ncbi:MAG: AAA family ATPase [Planctomycetaceae bacterium]|nr:AAA family ATPase [Planctomycetaceae bacterium]